MATTQKRTSSTNIEVSSPPCSATALTTLRADVVSPPPTLCPTTAGRSDLQEGESTFLQLGQHSKVLTYNFTDLQHCSRFRFRCRTQERSWLAVHSHSG